MVVAVAVVVVLVVVRRPIQHALYPDTGLKEWRATARRLSWSGRWRIYRAVNRGRVVVPRLAPLAVQRARMVLAVVDTMRRRRYLWWLFGVQTIVIALLLADAVILRGRAHEDDPPDMFWLYPVGFAVYLGALSALMSYTVRRAVRSAREAIRVNLAQQGELPDLRRTDQEEW